MKQKGESGGGVGVGWAWLPVRQAKQFVAGLAIWLANLPLSIRVQTTLLELNVSRSWSGFENNLVPRVSQLTAFVRSRP